MEQFGKKIRGFDRSDALLAGIESRTSSPLKIIRDENLESSVKGPVSYTHLKDDRVRRGPGGNGKNVSGHVHGHPGI